MLQLYEKYLDHSASDTRLTSSFLISREKGDRWLRLAYVARHEIIVVRCGCGRSVSIRGDFCSGGIGCRRICSFSICNFVCGARTAIASAGFRITMFDGRMRGDNWKPRLERVVVAGEDGEGANQELR